MMWSVFLYLRMRYYKDQVHRVEQDASYLTLENKIEMPFVPFPGLTICGYDGTFEFEVQSVRWEVGYESIWAERTWDHAELAEKVDNWDYADAMNIMADWLAYHLARGWTIWEEVDAQELIDLAKKKTTPASDA